jgi:hypothetical protein
MQMSHNPYSPPRAQVDGAEETSPFDFSANVRYSFTSRHLWWAGWCCVLGLVLTPLYIYFESIKAATPEYRGAAMATLFVMTGLSVYANFILKKLLTEKSGYRGANLGISLYILASIASTLAEPFIDHADALFTPLSIAELVLFGALTIYLGLKLLRCEDPLFGQMKLIAYLTIAMGIATASVLLVLLGILFSFPLAIALAKMFFRASHALDKVQA